MIAYPAQGIDLSYILFFRAEKINLEEGTITPVWQTRKIRLSMKEIGPESHN